MDFQEFSAYARGIPNAIPDVWCIGWLNSQQDFQVGKVPSHILEKIEQLSELPGRTIRGLTKCALCEFLNYEEKDIYHTQNEIWIPKVDFGYFAAPVLILHYIKRHNYLPPEDFLRAVENWDKSKPRVRFVDFMKKYEDLMYPEK